MSPNSNGWWTSWNVEWMNECESKFIKVYICANIQMKVLRSIIMLCCLLSLILRQVMLTKCVTIGKKVFEQYFHVVLFVMLYKIVKILKYVVENPEWPFKWKLLIKTFMLYLFVILHLTKQIFLSFFLNFNFSYLGTKIVEFYILPFTNLSHRKLSFW